MNLLLDTHIALWAIGNDARLSFAAREAIEAPRNRVVVSPVSIWEIAIKFALQRRGIGAMPVSGQFALEQFRRAGYEMLPVSAEHASGVDRLPAIHNDPFDRLLIAQALEEPLRLITRDWTVASYSEQFILA